MLDSTASETSRPAESESVPQTPPAGADGSPATRAAGESTDLDDVLRRASRNARKLVEAETARIWIARRGGRRLVAREFPDDNGSAAERRLGAGEGLAGWAISHERALRLGPDDARPPLRGEVPAFQSALVLPLFRRGAAFGALECLNRKGGGPFTDADVERLEGAAEAIAIALDNALLYRETERRALEKEMLLEIATALSAPHELNEVIEAILKALRQVVEYDAAAIYLVNRKTLALEMVREVGYPEGSEHAFDLQVGQGIVGWVAKTGQSLIVPDVASDARYVAARAQTRSEVATPLTISGRTIGVFNLESDREDAYHEGHLELLDGFAAQAAVAIERARLTQEQLERRRIEKELAIAREIQASFLPKAAPAIPGFEVAGATQPHDEVGGDYFDFVPVSDARVGLAIADVSGKGIPAALLMAGFRMSLLAEVRNEFAIRAVMRKVNSLMYESTERDKFVTAFYGVLDWRNQVLIFSNAGHNPPIMLRADGSFEYLEEGGTAFGVLPDSRYDERPIAIRPGDLLLLYTDGISEAEAPNGEQFGTRRIEQAMARLRAEPAAKILAGLIAEVTRWCGTRGPNDDLTLIVLKACPGGTRPPSSIT